MERRAFGPTGVAVPVIGQGTWMIEDGPRAEAVRSLQRGLDLGLSHLDTAEMYGDGEAEGIVGEAMRGRRDEVFVVSKVLPSHATRHGVVAACEASLTRLGTDRLDCYLLHWPGPHPFAETLAGFEALLSDGKILSFGVSNFDVPELEEALRLAGPDRLACNQVLYHLEERAIEHDVLPWCRAHEVALVGYSPFGSGRFPAEGSAGRAALDAVARAHGATPWQVALAFLTRDAHTFTIPKAATLTHVEANASPPVLTAADVVRLERALPRGPRPASLPVI